MSTTTGRTQSVVPVVLAGFTAFLGLYTTQPLLPLLAQVFHASRFAVTLTITAPTAGVALAAPFAGRLGDLFGRRRVIVTAAFAMAILTGLAATAQSLNQLIAWRFLQGLVTPGVFAVTIAYVHEQWPASQAGAVTSAYISGTILGGFTGRVLTGTVASSGGWHAAFFALGLLTLGMAVSLWMWLPRERAGVVRETGQRPRGSLMGAFANPQLLATYTVGFCVLFTLVGVFTYVTFLLAAPPFQLSTAALGYLFVVYLAGAAVTAGAGRWMDRFGHRAALAAGVAVGIVGTLMTLGPSLAVVGVGLAICCSGVFVAQATATSHLGVASARDRGVAVGLYATCYYLGGSAGGAVPAFFWDAGGWPACVALAVGVQLVMAAAALLVWRDPAPSPG